MFHSKYRDKVAKRPPRHREPDYMQRGYILAKAYWDRQPTKFPPADVFFARVPTQFTKQDEIECFGHIEPMPPEFAKALYPQAGSA
ncbi:hypothetical protein EXS62_02240 [Candidatus Kaiserbacteria bacterium]|nr:hypothetical protein [Candidatus Kaiserbacteria bacterium]